MLCYKLSFCIRNKNIGPEIWAETDNGYTKTVLSRVYDISLLNLYIDLFIIVSKILFTFKKLTCNLNRIIFYLLYILKFNNPCQEHYSYFRKHFIISPTQYYISSTFLILKKLLPLLY